MGSCFQLQCLSSAHDAVGWFGGQSLSTSWRLLSAGSLSPSPTFFFFLFGSSNQTRMVIL
jgi:hypothetical protein